MSRSHKCGVSIILVRGAAVHQMSLFLTALERSTRWDGRLVSWRGVVEACLWWNQLGKQQQKKRRWLGRGEPFMHVMFRLQSVERPFKIAAALRQICSGASPLVEDRETPDWGGSQQGARAGGCDRAQRSCAVCDSLTKLRDHRDHLSSFFRASPSGLSDRLKHRQSGMWVNPGTVGR